VYQTVGVTDCNFDAFMRTSNLTSSSCITVALTEVIAIVL